MDMHVNEIVQDSGSMPARPDLAAEIAGVIAGGQGRSPAELAQEVAAIVSDSYQRRVDTWMLACFGTDITMSQTERNSRFIEEALELVHRQKHASKPAEVIGDGAGAKSADQAATLDPLRAGLQVRFRYRNWRGEEADRHVEIRGLWYGATEWHKKPQWLLKAVDLDKNEPRDFAVRDILGPADGSCAAGNAG